MTTDNEGYGSNIPESEDPNRAHGLNNPHPDSYAGQQQGFTQFSESQPQQTQAQQPQEPGFQSQQSTSFPPPQPGYLPPQQPGNPGVQFNADPQLQGSMNSANGVLLNYWLSVFFSIIPALIFYFVVPKNSRYHQLHTDNLNFSILETLVRIGILAITPLLPWIAGILALAPLVFFVIHLIAAIKVSSGPDTMTGDPFPFNVSFLQ